MKKMMQNILRILAKAIIRKYQPKVVGITGSVGKTSAKQAIFAVISDRFLTRATHKNYNNELGLPLTVIGCDSPGRSIFGWFFVLLKGFWLLVWRSRLYPEVLVLEMGADRPGDIAYLVDIAPCNIGVITAIAEAHYEFFRDIDGITREKQTIITHLTEHDTAIFNADDKVVRTLVDKTKAKVVTFGLYEEAAIRAVDLKVAYVEVDGRSRPAGMHCKLEYEGAVVPVFLPGVLGKAHVKSGLAGVAVGISIGMHLVEIGERLARAEFPAGRMRVLDGIKHTTIIDDTYNSSPLALVFALDALRDVSVGEEGRRFAVLGDMLELGSITEDAHRDIGQRLQAFNVDELVVVGERAKFIADAAVECGFDEHCVYRFDKAEDAGKFIQEKLREGDVVLVKGSQGVRLERVVLEIMAQPEDAKRLLCRQDKRWK